MTLHVLAICGSLQASSGNLLLLLAAARSAPPGVAIQLFDGIRELPHFNPDLESAGVPDAVRAWRSALAASKAVLIACPEYGHSLPGALKNAIDWVIGSGELYGKIVAITAAVGAKERGRRGLAALRQTLQAVDARVVSDEPIVRGPAFDSDVAALVARLARDAEHEHAYAAAMTSESQDQRTPRVVPLAPHLTITGASKAIAFYERAFGARAGYVQMTPDDRVLHADLELPNGGVFFLNDDFPEHGGSRAPGAAPSPVTIHLELEDVDAVWERAVTAGASVETPLADQFWGARYGVLRDPFGHRWSLAKQIRQPTRAELDSAVKSFEARAGNSDHQG